jgi:tetratricopeptide (TPR) repeat protein
MKTLSVVISLFLFSNFLTAQSLVDKGKAFYEAKKSADAEKIFKTITEDSKDYASARYYLGRIAFDKKSYDEAQEYFEEATELDGNKGDYFNWLGDTYATIGSTASIFKQMSVGPKALRAWEKATQLDPKNISARVSLVGAYMQAPAMMGGGEDKSKAMATEVFPLLDEQLKKIPDHHLYNYWYGKSAAITGLNLNRGEECLLRYVTFKPVDDEPSVAAAYVRLGKIKERKGKKAEARAAYEMALKLDDSLKGAKEGLERTSK